MRVRRGKHHTGCAAEPIEDTPVMEDSCLSWHGACSLHSNYMLEARSAGFYLLVHIGDAVWSTIQDVVGNAVTFVQDHWVLLVGILTGPFGPVPPTSTTG